MGWDGLDPRAWDESRARVLAHCRNTVASVGELARHSKMAFTCGIYRYMPHNQGYLGLPLYYVSSQAATSTVAPGWYAEIKAGDLFALSVTVMESDAVRKATGSDDDFAAVLAEVVVDGVQSGGPGLFVQREDADCENLFQGYVLGTDVDEADATVNPSPTATLNLRRFQAADEQQGGLALPSQNLEEGVAVKGVVVFEFRHVMLERTYAMDSDEPGYKYSRDPKEVPSSAPTSQDADSVVAGQIDSFDMSLCPMAIASGDDSQPIETVRMYLRTHTWLEKNLPEFSDAEKSFRQSLASAKANIALMQQSRAPPTTPAPAARSTGLRSAPSTGFRSKPIVQRQRTTTQLERSEKETKTADLQRGSRRAAERGGSKKKRAVDSDQRLNLPMDTTSSRLRGETVRRFVEEDDVSPHKTVERVDKKMRSSTSRRNEDKARNEGGSRRNEDSDSRRVNDRTMRDEGNYSKENHQRSITEERRSHSRSSPRYGTNQDKISKMKDSGYSSSPVPERARITNTSNLSADGRCSTYDSVPHSSNSRGKSSLSGSGASGTSRRPNRGCRNGNRNSDSDEDRGTPKTNQYTRGVVCVVEDLPKDVSMAQLRNAIEREVGHISEIEITSGSGYIIFEDHHQASVFVSRTTQTKWAYSDGRFRVLRGNDERCYWEHRERHKPSRFSDGSTINKRASLQDRSP